jgi:hypothetical protein
MTFPFFALALAGLSPCRPFLIGYRLGHCLLLGSIMLYQYII